MTIMRVSILYVLVLSLLAACGGGGSAPAASSPPVAPPPAPPTLIAAGTLGDGSFEDVVANVRERHDVPAMGAIVVLNGLIADQAVDGRRAVEQGAAVTLADKWHIGSITKGDDGHPGRGPGRAIFD